MTSRPTLRTLPLIPITLRWGVVLAFVVALISGISVFVNAFAVKQLPDAAVYTTLKNGVAALILIIAALAVVPRPRSVHSIAGRGPRCR